ncbi:MAG: class I tRNA ligase family protein, partial [Syntrophomonadaceae bacterium]|nr:class I tRNA ligase family protein [Syntrophomonadaceae bacterium]
MRLYNTLIGAKEEFITLEPAEVKMYVCGPTTYNYIHLGNARPLVVFDTIRRYLEFKGYTVRYIQNFTDIDDKIINRAAEEGVEPLALSEKYIREYFTDADSLGIKRAHVHPRVSEHIDKIIAAVAKLVELNFAYELDGNVYYRVNSFANYGFLSHRSLEDMLAGARVEVDDRKEDPMDFALWKKVKPGELFWESPWGPGRPG